MLKEMEKKRDIKQIIKDRREKINQGIVPEGYKKTKVGIIPEDWEVERFKDVVIKSKEKFYPDKDKDNFKCIELEHINSETGVINGFIDSKSVKSTKIKFRKGEILYGKLRPYLKKYYYATFSGICSTEIWVFKAKREKLVSSFLYYIVQTNYFNYHTNISTGSSMPRADWNYVSNIKISIPSIQEQQKIADVLSTWDRAIELKESLIQEKEEQKKGLMERLLTPKENRNWKYFKLGDIGEFRTSSVNKKDDPNEYPVNLLNYMDVYNNKHINQKIDYMRTTATDHQIKTNDVQIGDVFFTPSSETRDDIGHSAVVTEEIKNLVYSYHLIRFRIHENVDFDIQFRAYCFNSKMILREMSRLATGSTRYTLSIDNFESIGFYLPPLSEQRRIAKILSTADREIELLKQEVEQLKEQKKGLMQLLLTGIVRVKEVEHE